MNLRDRSVVLGVTGGIAAYKSAELVRVLQQRGARVRVVMTRGAQQFITPLTLQTLSGHPVSTDLWDLTQESQIGHIALADSAEVLLIAPATANVIAKLASGIADDLLTTVALATRARLVVAPAMNVHMFENPVVQENLDRLRARGARIVTPDSGSLACGYEGQGRLPDPDVLAEEVAATESAPEIHVGTMIELPRAALCAGEIAEHADFFSFGTNDLTQMTLGYSRDDIASFVPRYIDKGILLDDPFQSIDVEGVGQLVRLACERGRSARPDLHLGICGEHGGDPRSITFFADVGLDYVSCSPFRVPVARLAAAQAALRGKVKAKQGEA